MDDVNVTPTTDLYGQLQHVADHFNRSLFDGALPSTVITLHRSINTTGFFSASRWRHVSGAPVSELALNSAFFATRPLIALCQTVVHELCHLWQHLDGSASRPGYHNSKWAKKMIEVGLMPSATGQPGGAATGQKMADYPLPDGRFLTACEELVAEGFALRWMDQGQRTPADYRSDIETKHDLRSAFAEQLLVPLGVFFPNLECQPPPEVTREKLKTKYNCPSCQSKVWGKSGLAIICSACDQAFVAVSVRPQIHNQSS